MKKIGIVLVLLLCMIIGACGMSAVQTIAEQNGAIKIWSQSENGDYDTLLVVDEATGVNYIVVSWTKYGNPGGIAITPRLNKNSTFYNSK